MYLGTEQMARGQFRKAIPYLRRYLKQLTGWDEERAQVHRKLAVCLAQTGDAAGAVRVALDALTVLPSWPDSALTLAEAHYELREPAKAIHWANVVLAAGVPDTLLIVNPLDYLVQPHVVLAGAYAALGDTEQAIGHAEHVLRLQPGHATILPAYRGWLVGRKREHTASTFIACAQMLIGHDEQLKALDVLRSVPHYAIDEPASSPCAPSCASALTRSCSRAATPTTTRPAAASPRTWSGRPAAQRGGVAAARGVPAAREAGSGSRPHWPAWPCGRVSR
jgi:Tfp pilus assembly protein PilF